jgi:hypothetical protein
MGEGIVGCFMKGVLIRSGTMEIIIEFYEV